MFDLRLLRNQMFNTNDHIIFVKNPSLDINFQTSKYSFVGPQSLNLFNTSYQIDIYELIPRLFTITTCNNIPHKFNISLLKETSEVIAKFIVRNPDKLEFKIDIEDDLDVLGKFEQMYLGKKVIFEEKELQTAAEITENLQIINCPNYLRSSERANSKYDLNSGVGFYLFNSNIFFTIEGRKTFKIITNKKQYDCNIFAVYSSKIIRDFLSENPKADHFEYNYEDGFDEFQSICNLFNFKDVPISVNNMDSLKEIIDDLQITYFTEMIDLYVKDYEKVSRTIDDQQTIIDSIEGLFELLYNIKVHTVEKVKEFIVDSFWSKTEENVQELVAFILQVIRTDFKYHPYLIDLLIQLDKEANETNNLHILIPFMVKKLLFFLGENNLNCSFVYNLYQKGVISKSEIIECLKKILNDSRIKFNNNPLTMNHENHFILAEDTAKVNLLSLYSWFLSEIVEIDKFEQEIVFKKGPSFGTFIGLYYPDKLDDYKAMRDKGEPEDPLTLALRNDDVETLQTILSKNGFYISDNDSARTAKYTYQSRKYQQDESQFTVPFNIFEEFVLNGQTKYIDYAAAYGSIKCFKYLLLNHCSINETTFKFAVFGGNIEIIKIVDQKTSNKAKNSMIFSLFSNREMDDRDFPSIMKHQNDLFDWILQEKYLKSDPNSNLKESLLISSAKNGNVHALIGIIDNGNDYMKYSKDIIEIASKNGFYRFTNLFINILPQKNEKVPLFKKLVYISVPFVCFGNLSLFKLYCKTMKVKKEFERALELSVARDYSNIIDYCFELFKHENMTISIESVFNCLNISISMKESNKAFNYLIHQFELNDPTVFKCFKKFNYLLSKACALKNLEITKTITNIIFENKLKETFTRPFYNAAVSGSFEICQFLIDKKVFINYRKLATQILKLSTINEKIFDLIVKNADKESQKIFLSCYIGSSIEMGNKDLTEYLFKEKNVKPEDELFKAVNNNDLNLVDIILTNNKDPSLINKKYKNGTALAMAVKNNDLPMVKRLLSVPGIDPSLYGDENKTPLLLSITNLNLEILNEILSFYGDSIQSQKWQIDKALKMALKLISTKSKSSTNLNYLWGGNKSSSSTSNLSWDKNKTENHTAKKTSILSIVKRLLEIDSIDFNIHAGNYTILSYACEMNEIEIVQMLLDSNKVNVNLYSPSSGNTPLITAIEFKNTEIAKLLIEYPKTNINMRNYQDHTALTTAVDKNLLEIIDLLINNEKFNADEINLNYAFLISTGETAKALMKAKDLDVNYKISLDFKSFKGKSINKDYLEMNEDSLFKTPLIEAINLNNFEKMKLIIHHPSFDKDRSLLRKSLFISVLNKSLDIFNYLITMIDDVNICDVDSESLLKFAVKNGTKEMIPIILNNKSFDSEKSDILSSFFEAFEWPSDESIEIMNILCNYDKEHNKLIDFSSLLPNGKSFFTSIGFSDDQTDDLKYTKVAPTLQKVTEIVQFLLDHGADPNMPDKNGFYPLEYAIILNSIEFVRVLLNSNKIEISKKIPTKTEYFFFLAQQYDDALCESDAKFKSYLHLSARSKDAQILEEFLQRKLIDINIVDDIGETPLMDACRFNKVDNIKLLFKYDELDYLHKNDDGEDAIQICQNILDISRKCNIKSKKEYLNYLISCLRDEEEEEDFEEDFEIDMFGNHYNDDDINDINEDIEVD